jgi:uncharacterized membrane protein
MSTAVTTPNQETASPSRRSPWTRPKYLFFGFIALMYLYVIWNNESFLINSKDQEWVHIASFKWWLLPHGLAAACALFLGPLQFSDRLRRRYAKAHRVLGRVYIAGVLVGAPLGIYIQYFEERLGGTRSFTIATVADAGVWICTTLVALAFILKGKVQPHRQWMTRSLACSFIFLEVRVILGFTHWEQYAEIVVWGCVAAAVPLADLALQIEELLRTRASRAKAARGLAQAV